MSEDTTQIQIDVLYYLRKHPRSYIPVRKLGEKFELSTNKIERIIAELENWGYQLLRNKSGEIRYGASPDVLFPHEVAFGLDTKVLGANVYSFDRVGSTNTLAHKYAEKDEPEGTLILAERQTAGRGRLGRSWHSPAKRGVYMSLILRPQIPPLLAPGLSLIAALSIAKTIREYPGIKATIKWPNDVLYEGAKLAGVLTELAAEIDRVKYVIMGIGLNVNHEQDDFPVEIQQRATSLHIAAHAQIDRIRIVKNLLTILEEHYHEYLALGFKRLIKPIKSYSSVLGKTINFRQNDETCTGTAIDIDAQGLLIVKVGNKTMSLSSGEISLHESY
jgi:BirA family transcriptional regulator, biotin operon repressor / biotin---[acetyl-CoA-carboxylase] ligase